MLFFIVLWQGLFNGCSLKYEKNGMCRMSLSLVRRLVYNDASIFLTLSVIKPEVFIIGTLYELRRVSGCISIKNGGKINSKTNMMGVKS